MVDTLVGQGECVAKSFVHFAPGLRLTAVDEGVWQVGDSLRLELAPECSATLEETEYFPEFGRCLEKQTLVISRSGELPLEISYKLEKYAT